MSDRVRIVKYSLGRVRSHVMPPPTRIEMPVASRPLSVTRRGDDVSLWVEQLAEPVRRELRGFLLIASREEFTLANGSHFIGTVEMDGGFAIHVYEFGRPTPLEGA